MTKIYAGIGSRETPKEVCIEIQGLAKTLANEGYVLRSGGATGADEAFETGCRHVIQLKKRHPLAEIYLTWEGFNGRNTPYGNDDVQA